MPIFWRSRGRSGILAHLDTTGYEEIKMYVEHTVGSATIWISGIIQENKRDTAMDTIFEWLKNQNIAYSIKADYTGTCAFLLCE